MPQCKNCKSSGVFVNRKDSIVWVCRTCGKRCTPVLRDVEARMTEEEIINLNLIKGALWIQFLDIVWSISGHWVVFTKKGGFYSNTPSNFRWIKEWIWQVGLEEILWYPVNKYTEVFSLQEAYKLILACYSWEFVQRRTRLSRWKTSIKKNNNDINVLLLTFIKEECKMYRSATTQENATDEDFDKLDLLESRGITIGMVNYFRENNLLEFDLIKPLLDVAIEMGYHKPLGWVRITRKKITGVPEEYSIFN